MTLKARDLGWDRARIATRARRAVRAGAGPVRAAGPLSGPALRRAAPARRADARADARSRGAAAWTSRSARSIPSSAPTPGGPEATIFRRLEKTVLLVTHDMSEAGVSRRPRSRSCARAASSRPGRLDGPARAARRSVRDRVHPRAATARSRAQLRGLVIPLVTLAAAIGLALAGAGARASGPSRSVHGRVQGVSGIVDPRRSGGRARARAWAGRGRASPQPRRHRDRVRGAAVRQHRRLPRVHRHDRRGDPRDAGANRSRLDAPCAGGAGIGIGEPLGFSDSYALAVTRARQQRAGPANALRSRRAIPSCASGSRTSSSGAPTAGPGSPARYGLRP